LATDGKTFRDRFLLFEKHCKLADTREALRTGHEQEVTPLDKVLVPIMQVAQDHKRVEEHERGEASRREDRFVATGEATLQAEMKRRRNRTVGAWHRHDVPLEPVGGQKAPLPNGLQRRRRDCNDEEVVGEMQSFYDRRLALAQKKLDLMEQQLEQQR